MVDGMNDDIAFRGCQPINRWFVLGQRQPASRRGVGLSLHPNRWQNLTDPHDQDGQKREITSFHMESISDTASKLYQKPLSMHAKNPALPETGFPVKLNCRVLRLTRPVEARY